MTSQATRVIDDIPSAPVPARRVVAWALWDWGSAAFNAVITTFVFTRWLTSDAFVTSDVVAAAAAEEAAKVTGGPGQAALDAVLADHSSWLGWGLAAAGVLIALIAPVTGARSDDAGRRRLWLGIHTGITVAICAGMFFVTPNADALETNLLVGIFLLAVGNIFFELASVNYNAMLSQVSTRKNVGRISGLGWGAGYIGGIVLLLILFVGFINPEVGWFGVTDAGGLNIRVAVLASALWFAAFAIPVLIAVPEVPASTTRARLSVPAAYRKLFTDVAGLWRDRRDVLRFLIASAVYRDGLAGVFTFGAVIASVTFGFSASGVIVFAIAANVVSGLATMIAGFVEDSVGPKAIIVTSLVGLLVSGIAVFVLHDGGQTIFWIFGLLLCVFVGPAQSSSRALLMRRTPPGREAEIFGLYATTGRAASFMAPAAWAAFIAVTGTQHFGILGLMLVLLVGLLLLLPVPGVAASADRRVDDVTVA
ncbi:MFS transporter [Sanguibacter sp. A247]|uniref:MFS transporter n=1 Tax=unclassified Sanguibacter TaxID=2645534 RepID=UPI003FD8A9FC